MTDLRMAAVPVQVGDRRRYDALMDVMANRITTRAFRPDYVVPRSTLSSSWTPPGMVRRGPMHNRGTTSSSPTLTSSVTSLNTSSPSRDVARGWE